MKKRLLLPFSLLCLAGMIVACTEQGGTSQQSQPSQPDSSINSESSEPTPSVPSSPSSSSHSSSSSTNPPAPSSSEAPINYEVSITNAANLAEEWFASDGNRTLVLACNPGVVRQLIGKEIFVASSDESIVKVENNQVLVPVAPGKVTITVIYHNAYATCKVTVKGMTRPATIEEIAKGVAAKTITNSDKPVELFGTVTGIYGNTAIIQEGDYAMYVYNKNYEGIAVGDRAHLISTYTLYNGLVETSAVTIFEKSTKEAEAIVAKDYDETSFAALKAEDASRLINVTGIYSLGESLSKGGCAAQASASAYRLSSVKIGEMNSYIFVNKYLEQSVMNAINAKLNEAEAESKKIEVKGGHVYVNTSYMDNLAISITSADQLILKDSDVVTLPTAVELTGGDKVAVDETIKLTPKFTPSNTNRKGLSYASDNDAVATVSAEGVVKGISAGTANITATSTADGCENVKATFKVTVTAAEFVTAPVESETYLLGLHQGNLSKKLYLNGEMENTYYYKTVEDKALAAQVKVEKKGDEENKYALKIGDQYLRIEVGGRYVNTVMKADPFYFTWDPVKCAFYDTVTTCENANKNGDCYLGTSGSYVTVSAANSQTFFLHLYPFSAEGVYKFDGDGSETNPYSVRDALHVIDGLEDGVTTADSFTIRGILKEVTTAYSDQYGNITFTIGDKADSTKLLTCFRVKCSAETAALLVPGTGVAVTGKLQRYVKGTDMTPELAAGGSVEIVPIQYLFDGEGTDANPYSVADALHIIDGLDDGATTSDSFVIKGILKAVTTAYSSQYGNITFTIGDKEDSTELLTCFRVACDADTAALLVAGTEVKVNGKLQRYVKNDVMTPELAAGGSVTIIPAEFKFDGEGTEAKPYSVRDALHIIDGLEDGATTSDSFVIKGILKAVTTAYSSQYGNITFTIGDKADSTELLTCFRVACDADTAALLVAGADVTVTGKLQRYVKNDTMTPELAAGGSVAIKAASYAFDGEGTEAKPYSVADALHIISELADGATTSDSFVIKGVLKEVTTAYSSQYGNITFTIGDKADSTELLTCFRVACDADTAALLVGGAEVTVTGKLQRYVKNDTMTPELAAGGTVTVGPAAHHFTGAGTAENPYTVDDALYLINELEDGATTADSFVIKGVLKEVTTAYSSQYGNITFTIGDKADSTDLLTCFRVACDADTAALLVAGAEVTVTGKLQRYVKNNVMTPELAAGGTVTVGPAAHHFTGGGTAENPYTVDDALYLINELEDGATTADSFVIKGVLKEVTTAYSSQYGNITFTIGDKADSTELLTCFRVACDADTAALLVAGAKVTVTGKLQKYVKNNVMTPELAAGGTVVVETSQAHHFTGAGTAENPYTVDDALYLISELEDGATTADSFVIKGILKEVTTAYSDQYGNITFTIGDKADSTDLLTCFRVACDADKAALLVAGKEVTVTGKLQRYVKNNVMTPELAAGGTVTVAGGDTPVVPPEVADNTTLKVTTADLVADRNFTVSAGSDAHMYTSIGLDKAEDADITISTTGEPNCGSFWGNSREYRIYQAKKGNLIVTAKEGLTIVSVKLTFGISNNGTLLLNGNAVSSNSVVEVNGSSIEFTVGNSGTANNGQVKFTAFEVVYKAAQAAEEPGYTISFNSSHSEIYVYESGQDYTVAPVKTNSTLSRDEEGTITKWIEPEEATTLEPQVNFKVVYEDGYEVTADSIAITGEYNKIKIAETNKDQNYVIIRVTKIKSNLSITVTPTAVQAGAVDGFEVNFVLEHCTVKVYVGPKDANGSNVDTSEKYYTRSKDDPWGYSKDAAQFNFEIIPEAGYVFNDGLEWGTATELSSSAVSFISPTSSFNKIKKSANGGYTLTKVAGTLTITVSCTAA